MKYRYPCILYAVIALSACKTKSNQSYFTGTIEYTYTYSSNLLNADSLAKAMPAKSRFRYDLENYQSVFYGKDTTTWYYSGRLNKCIGKLSSQPDLTCEDYAAFTDSVLSWKLYDTDEKIMGYACRVLEMQTTHSWVKYYVSREQMIAPGTYRRHRSYNWDVYGEKTGGGLILKSEHRFTNFTMQGIATGIKQYGPDFTALELNQRLFSERCGNQ
jgi:hypothetical protein